MIVKLVYLLSKGKIVRNKYNWAPKRLELTVIINGPIHIPINKLVKAYSELPFVLKAHNDAVNKVIINGPHISHSFLNLS